MVMKFSLLVLVAAVSHGAVVPVQEDALFDMVQSFLTGPDQYIDALGMSRVKRSTYDREFNIAALGAHVGVKFNDPSNKLKGGSADITIDNLKKLVKQAKSTKVVLKVKFDSGKSPKDGLFNMNVNYELHHGMVEKGSFSVNREKVGDKWVTKIDSKKDSKAGGQIIPGFSLSLKSDRKTSLVGEFSCDKGYKYEIDVDRVPGKKIHAVIKGNGKVYTVDGTLDKDGKTIDVVVDANGKKINAKGAVTESAKAYDAELKAKYGKSDYTVKLTGAKDYSMGGVTVKMGDSVVAKVEVQGEMQAKREGGRIVEINRMQYVADVDTLMGKGAVKYGMSNKGKKMIQKLELSMAKMEKIEVSYQRKLLDNYGRHMQLTIKKGGKSFIDYVNDFKPSVTSDKYILDATSELTLNKKSKTYEFFCNYGCFTKRSMKSQVVVDKKTPYKITVDAKLKKDDQNVLELDINTVNSPYEFNLQAPRLLPKILPSGRGSIEFKADHKPGQYLKVTSNTNSIKSFNVEKMGNGMRKVSLNGKELVTAGLNQGDNTITQTTKLPNGMEATTTVSWKHDDMKHNDVDIKIEATNRKMDAKMKWDVRDMSKMAMYFDVKGNNPRMGKYHIERDIKMSSVGNDLNADITGTTSVDNAPWPSPIDTNVKAHVNMNSGHYMFDINKTIAGTAYGITMKDGRLSFNL